MTHIKSIVLSITFIFLTFLLQGQTTSNVKKPKIERVSQALGYIVGQEYSLNYIKNEFPQLENKVLVAEMAFKSTFGKSKLGMEDYLSNYLGEDKLKDFNDNLIEEIQKRMSNQTYSEEIAINFIEELEKRANGNIPNPILETLLSFQYIDSPNSEFSSGFTNIFKTKGHSKSKNTDWQIRVPKSWKAKEADRPNIIQSFIDDFGDGLNNIMLMVKDINVPKGTKFSNQEKNDFFTKKGIKIMVPQGAKFITFSKMTLDSNIGGMLEIEQTVSRLDFKMKMRIVQFMFIRGCKIYTLTGTVSSANMEDDLGPKMEKYLPLFKLVANSIVVNDQYK
jgi:hypothetical protein